MSGPRILLVVLVAAAALLWMALAGPRDADLDRGLKETEQAFAAVDEQLAALDPDYQTLRAQNLALGLRDAHDQIVTHLAELRSRRLDIASDASLERRLRLPRLRDLVAESDELLALALGLRRECAALLGLRRASQPLVADARRRRDLLAQKQPRDDEERHRIEALASSLGDIEQRLAAAEQQIRRNLDQGIAMGQGVLRDLQTLIDQQRQAGAEP